MPSTFYVIDGHAQFFRAYHAIRTGMTSPVTGEPTNMTFGFVAMVLKVLREHRPDHLAVAIDVSGDRQTFRSEIYPEYKSTRDEPPEDLRPQIDRCLELLALMGIPVLGTEGVEADDVIATLVTRLRESDPDLEIRIVSKDKDLAQLLDDHVRLIDVHADTEVSPADLFKTEGVEPRHVADILALMGDSVDNVPGVPGIGPKTAAKLILQYGSLEGLLDHLGELEGKRRENLEASREQVALSRRLVELRRDVALDPDLAADPAAARVDPAALPLEPLLDAFRSLGFNRHQDDLRALVGADPAPAGAGRTAPASGPGDGEPGLFGGGDDAPAVAARTPAGDYELVTTVEALDAVIDRIRSAGRCAVDTETDGLSAIDANLCGVCLAVEPKHAWYVPVRSPEPDRHLGEAAVVERLRPVLEDTSIELIGHHLKFDLEVLHRAGIERRSNCFDTMIASYLLDPSRSSHKLDVLALALLSHACIPIGDVLGHGKVQRTFDEVPLDDALLYAAEDADVTLRLAELLAPRLADDGLETLFRDVEMPLVPILGAMERRGIIVDPAELERQRTKLETRIASLRDEIADIAPGPLNPDSPKQLAAALFNGPDDDPPGLGLKPTRRGKTGPSTDQEVLETLAADPSVATRLPEMILEYRQLTKLVGTYLTALAEQINPRTGRVHASFHQTVAATGRLSSSDPNLQNIPIRTEVGREIRRAFVAEPGSLLLTADYSQIELRLLAHLAEDAALIEAFRAGADIHRAVAAEVFGVEPEAVTAEQRGTAKMVNFGIVYGITPYGLARRLGPDVSVEDAKAIIEGYKARFAGIGAFLQACIEEAERDGSVRTILGRRRPIPQIHARQHNQRQLGERLAINSVVQGSAADLIKVAMVDLDARLRAERPNVHLLLQVHDELVLEVPTGDLESTRSLVTDRMERAMDLKVPLVVRTAASENWIDAK